MSETIIAEHQKQLDEDMAAYPSNIADTINPDTNDVNAVSLSPFLKYLLLVDHRHVVIDDDSFFSWGELASLPPTGYRTLPVVISSNRSYYEQPRNPMYNYLT